MVEQYLVNLLLTLIQIIFIHFLFCREKGVEQAYFYLNDKKYALDWKYELDWCKKENSTVGAWKETCIK